MSEHEHNFDFRRDDTVVAPSLLSIRDTGKELFVHRHHGHANICEWPPCNHAVTVDYSKQPVEPPPCPYCRIQQLERVAVKVLWYFNQANTDCDSLEVLDALADAGYNYSERGQEE
jgi:hypothetical protein